MFVIGAEAQVNSVETPGLGSNKPRYNSAQMAHPTGKGYALTLSVGRLNSKIDLVGKGSYDRVRPVPGEVPAWARFVIE